MTVDEAFDYAELLINKFGSLEKALDAETVVHCRDCWVYHPDKGICNKPHESSRCRLPDEYCSDGRYYKRNKED